jgi:hypothetical protein
MRLVHVLQHGITRGDDLRWLTSAALTVVHGHNWDNAVAIHVDSSESPIEALMAQPWSAHADAVSRSAQVPITGHWNHTLDTVNELIKTEQYDKVDDVVDAFARHFAGDEFVTGRYMPAFVAKQASAAFKRGDTSAGRGHLAKLPARWIETLRREKGYCAEQRDVVERELLILRAYKNANYIAQTKREPGSLV